MQRKHRISLNAIRLFVLSARTGSLAATAAQMGVTPSAVSHQIKNLEAEMRMTLFRRRNNSIELTDYGQRLYEEVAPAITMIERSIDALAHGENQVSVLASTSLALRWLISSLDRFRASYPQIRVKIETCLALEFPVAADADFCVRYFRVGSNTDGWELLSEDISSPVVAPALLAENDATLENMPIICSARDNWDWRLWCKESGYPFDTLKLAHEFDGDDSALHACVAGMGIVLAPSILIQREVQTGALVAMPNQPSVLLGSYRIRRQSGRSAVRKFGDWLRAEMQQSVA